MVVAYERQEFDVTLNLDELKQEALEDLEEQLEEERRKFEEQQEERRRAQEQNAVVGGIRKHLALQLDQGITVTEFAKIIADKNLRAIIGKLAMSDILPQPPRIKTRAPRGSLPAASADELETAKQEALTAIKAKKGDWVPTSLIRNLVSVRKLSNNQKSTVLYAYLEGVEGMEVQGQRADKAFCFNG